MISKTKQTIHFVVAHLAFILVCRWCENAGWLYWRFLW